MNFTTFTSLVLAVIYLNLFSGNLAQLCVLNECCNTCCEEEFSGSQARLRCTNACDDLETDVNIDPLDSNNQAILSGVAFRTSRRGRTDKCCLTSGILAGEFSDECDDATPFFGRTDRPSPSPTLSPTPKPTGSPVITNFPTTSPTAAPLDLAVIAGGGSAGAVVIILLISFVAVRNRRSRRLPQNNSDNTLPNFSPDEFESKSNLKPPPSGATAFTMPTYSANKPSFNTFTSPNFQTAAPSTPFNSFVPNGSLPVTHLAAGGPSYDDDDDDDNDESEYQRPMVPNSSFDPEPLPNRGAVAAPPAPFKMTNAPPPGLGRAMPQPRQEMVIPTTAKGKDGFPTALAPRKIQQSFPAQKPMAPRAQQESFPAPKSTITPTLSDFKLHLPNAEVKNDRTSTDIREAQLRDINLGNEFGDLMGKGKTEKRTTNKSTAKVPFSLPEPSKKPPFSLPKPSKQAASGKVPFSLPTPSAASQAPKSEFKLPSPKKNSTPTAEFKLPSPKFALPTPSLPPASKSAKKKSRNDLDAISLKAAEQDKMLSLLGGNKKKAEPNPLDILQSKANRKTQNGKKKTLLDDHDF